MPSDRPFRLFDATVVAIDDLSPHLRRIRFGGPDLEAFADPGADTRIKLVLPRGDQHGGDALRLGEGAETDWYAAWLALAEEERPPMRTYTTRRVLDLPEGRVLDVDLVVHEASGPAGDWAVRARVGDRILVVGPDREWEGTYAGRVFAPPTTAAHLVLAGDETALPAIARILEDLVETDADGSPTVDVFVEVPTAADVLDLVLPDRARVTWLPRGDAAPGTLLDPAVREWARLRPGRVGTEGSDASDETEAEAPDDADAIWEVPLDVDVELATPDGPLGDVYLWIAAESGVVTTIRRHLVRDLGVPKERVAFMGYWKLGAAL